MNYVLNFTEQKLTINSNAQQFHFDLRDGDCGDFWSALTLDGKLFDVNCCWDETGHSVSLYRIIGDLFNCVLWEKIEGISVGNPDLSHSWGVCY